jgi:hypothetical protein
MFFLFLVLTSTATVSYTVILFLKKILVSFLFYFSLKLIFFNFYSNLNFILYLYFESSILGEVFFSIFNFCYCLNFFLIQYFFSQLQIIFFNDGELSIKGKSLWPYCRCGMNQIHELKKFLWRRVGIMWCQWKWRWTT